MTGEESVVLLPPAAALVFSEMLKTPEENVGSLCRWSDLVEDWEALLRNGKPACPIPYSYFPMMKASYFEW